MFLKTSTRRVADISIMGAGGESFYPARREMLVKGTKFCNSFGCMKDCCYAESGGEDIDDLGFEEDIDDCGLGNPTRTFSEAEMKVDERLTREKKPVNGSELLMSEKPVIGNGLLMSEKPVTGNPVKSGKTYAQAVSGGGSVDADGFELVKSKNKRVDSLGIRMPEGLKSVEEAPEWEEIEMAVDSGASESVVSEDMLTRVTTVEGDAQKK